MLALGCLLLAAAGLGGYALQAMHRVRPFYAEAVQAPPEQLQTAAQRMEDRVEDLVSEPAPVGAWEMVFSDEEVNGWLVTILQEKYPTFLPPQVADPRVAFRENRCMLGYRYRGKTLETVISIEGAASLPEDDLAAVRLRKAFAGLLPLPMSRVVQEVALGAEKLGIPIRWAEEQGDPVLLVSVADALSTDNERRTLQRIELRDGELLLAGSVEPRETAAAAKGSTAMSDIRLPAWRSGNRQATYASASTPLP
ncbi:MAG: hypothetical protein IT424_05045 [Pirellulales bacterium]|nr:hypothetical protein [Pirellulales bacterium]